jgi:hypothetical protein
MTEAEDASRYGNGMRKSMAILGLLPIVLATLPLYALLWGATLAVAHTLFWFLLGLLLIEALSIGFQRVPFTCSYAPGKANAKLLWPLYLAALVTYAYVPAPFEVWLLVRPARWAAACALLAACLASAALYRRWSRSSVPLRYEDTRDESIALELTTR